MYQHSTHFGFSLIELMMVLLLLSILTILAYPSYVQHITKTRRMDAIVALSNIQIELEQCYAQNTSYQKNCPNIPSSSLRSPQGFYRITIATNSPHTYTLTAIPQGTQRNDHLCARFVTTQNNKQQAFDTSGAPQIECWIL